MTIAQTILAQLGGNRFIAMTGAKNLVAGERSLMFSFGKNASKANKARITLIANDTYTVEFFKIRGINIDTVEIKTGLYADQLRSVFTAVTGLETSL